MIRLYKKMTPLFFNPTNVADLTQEYKTKGTSVWKNHIVQDSLLEISHKKCAYCEIKLNEKSTYLEVEHFKDKHSYPDDVIKWENLLPSCKHCNGSKSTHDVLAEPIVNPFTTDPSTHLSFKNYRMKGKTAIGKMTIEVLNLNDNEHFVKPRCEVGAILEDKLENAQNSMDLYIKTQHHATKRKITGLVRGILSECQENSLFSAASATIIHTNTEYLKLRSDMLAHGIWNNSLEELHIASSKLSLPYP
ncbi:HNH endonuclease [Kluyvera cryocrescens]|uniref:HNH endonuclease n=1 Tax=Kluyvera cryocrescens TaxID=580 RepID=UPI00224A660A|nr:HNH endonuclease [Kluyvera cryocrescens]MCX2865994.1 HNH endonuclease [Kluyvera cryocrescens]